MIVSIVYNGEQMIKPINDLGIDVACFGNHEFVKELRLQLPEIDAQDLTLDVLNGYIERTNFPWLLSNVKTRVGSQNLAGSKESLVINKNGFKVERKFL